MYCSSVIWFSAAAQQMCDSKDAITHLTCKHNGTASEHSQHTSKTMSKVKQTGGRMKIIECCLLMFQLVAIRTRNWTLTCDYASLLTEAGK